MKNILGGKGSGLAEMTAAGMPVPQGFTITTEACTQYYADGRQLNDALVARHFRARQGPGGDHPARSSATTPTPCWCLSVPAPVSPCPA